MASAPQLPPLQKKLADMAPIHNRKFPFHDICTVSQSVCQSEFLMISAMVRSAGSMDFSRSEVQQVFQDSVRRWPTEDLAPAAVARAIADDYPRGVARKTAEKGLI